MSISHSELWLLNFWQGLAEMLLAELCLVHGDLTCVHPGSGDQV